MNLPHDLEFDVTYRYVDDVPAFNIPPYHELDARLGWQATSNVELSVVGENLLHPRHLEFASNFVEEERTDVQRSVLGKITVRY